MKQLQENLNETNKQQYADLQDQLNDIIENEVKGSILRSLCKDYESGEKCSKYFFSLEKYRGKQKTISRLQLSDGSFTSDPKLILNECRSFYQKLYSANAQVDPDSFPFFYQNPSIPKLSDEQKAKCDIDLTEEELFKTLKNFKKNKSPGMDGITAEFYIMFWDQIKSKLFSVYSEAFVNGILPICLRTGVITLLEKKGKDRLDIANWRPITLLGKDYKLLTKTLGERLKTTLPGLIHKDQNGFVPGGNIFFSAHTIRDILFYCKKENLDLILLALDYSKAFDSVNFKFIDKTFELFNFGENFRKWIKIIFNRGKSCISNNGNISETFDIKRSTRQGDPISPLIFILCLEILFITIRSDENIEGFRVENNELKLTSYADDASYFLKNRISAENLLQCIQKFSKISGLEVNKSKSECLLLDYETGFAGLSDDLLGIPIVSNLKILGHFHGKDKVICDFQNFYSKLNTMENIIKMWKQRHLTILGKNVLINALINSSFLFNAQIEIPPPNFIKLVDQQNKNFLWGGTAKIAHNTLIADYNSGGIRYKDLDCFIISINMKFLLNLTSKTVSCCTILPRLWLNTMLRIPSQCINENQRYFYNFFKDQLNVLDCKLNAPRKNNWRGHPFYFEILKSFEKVICKLPQSYENILSIPLWYNKHLKTKFDVDISRAGFNSLKDLYPNGQMVDLNINSRGLSVHKIRKINKLFENMPEGWVNCITNFSVRPTVLTPSQVVNYCGADHYLQQLGTDRVYNILISKMIKVPTGVTRWRAELVLSEEQLKTSLRFARKCSSLVFDHVFQYKIVTPILPTKKYLHRYLIADSDLCTRCSEFADTVYHNLWQCSRLSLYLTACFDFLRNDCNLVDTINAENYLFGFMGQKREGLNQILLELKKHVFYNWCAEVGVDAFCEHLKSKVKTIMIKEKLIALSKNRLALFNDKWEQYTAIYDFRGPDIQVYS